MSTWAIVVAGGSGERFGERKQYLALGDRSGCSTGRCAPPPAHADGVVLVVPADVADRARARWRTSSSPAARPARRRCGRAWRRCPTTPSVIVVHDAARPVPVPGVWQRVLAAHRRRCRRGGARRARGRHAPRARRRRPSTGAGSSPCRRRRPSGPRRSEPRTPASPRAPTTRRWSRRQVAGWWSWTATRPTSRSRRPIDLEPGGAPVPLTVRVGQGFDVHPFSDDPGSAARAGRGRASTASGAWPATATPTRSPTPSPTRSSARPASATSASTSPTPIPPSPVPTASSCCAEPSPTCARRAGRPATSTAPWCSRRRSSRRAGTRWSGASRDAVGAPVTVKGKRRRGARRARATARASPASRSRSSRGRRLMAKPPRKGTRSGRRCPRRRPAGRRPRAACRPGGRGRPRRRAAGEAGRRRPGPRHGKRQGLGGDQVEGRQAVRELLLAGRRKVREIWLLAEQDPSDVLDDIVELAEAERVPVRVRSAGASSSPRPAARRPRACWPRPRPSRRRCSTTSPRHGPVARRRSSSRSTASPIPATSGPCCARPSAPAPPGSCCPATGRCTSPRRSRRRPRARSSTCRSPSSAVSRRRSSSSRSTGVWVVGLDGGGSTGLWDLPAADGPIALVLGAEGAGCPAWCASGATRSRASRSPARSDH